MKPSIRYALGVWLVLVAPPLAAEVQPDPACGGSAIALRIASSSEARVRLEVVARGETWHEVRIAGRRYVGVCVPGFATWSAPGEPSLPASELVIRIPPGTRPRLAVSEVAAEDVALQADFAYAPRAQVHGHAAPAPARRAPRGIVFGERPAEIVESGFAGSERLATVRIWPARHRTGSALLSLRRRMLVDVLFVPDARAPRRAVLRENATELSRYVAINPPPRHRACSAAKSCASAAAPAVDLVIAHADHQLTLGRYVYYKQLCGREVREHYVQGKSAAEIKEIIRREYASAVPPTSTLLVGNIDQIPSWRGSSDNTWTDFKYTEITGDNLPDLALGRVPAHDIDELNAFINKAIARETETRRIGDVLLTSGRDNGLGCPSNVARVGENIAAATGVNLIRKLRTEVGTDEVIRAYGDSPNLIVYDGHGNRQGMQEIPLLISSLSRLSNTAFPIVLDIACLNANWGSSASPRNFAESILLQADHGAAGIMASGGSGGGHSFFRSIGSLMARAKSELTTDPRGNEIGRILLAAKIQSDNEARTYWNYYGDPASSVWESTMHPATW